jgi:hypothetical protein
MLSLTQTAVLNRRVREIEALMEYCVHRLAVLGASSKDVAAASTAAVELDDALSVHRTQFRATFDDVGLFVLCALASTSRRRPTSTD